MYTFILQHKLETFLLAVALSAIASLLVASPTTFIRAFALHYGPAFSAAFYIIALFDNTNRNWTILLCFAIEFSVLLLYIRLIYTFTAQKLTISRKTIDKYLLVLLIIRTCFFFYLFSQSGFGLLSDGSRIDFMGNNPINKFISYTTLPITAIQAGLIAKRISNVGKVGILAIFTIGITIIFSITSGSKGSGILWFTSILALLDYKSPFVKIRSKFSIIILTIITASTALTVNVVSKSLNLTNSQFIQLAVSRFFMNNDSRAMALEINPENSSAEKFVRQTFPAAASKFGYPPENRPLGFHLYEQYFSREYSNTGGNSSLTALISYYAPPSLIASISLLTVFSLSLTFLIYNEIEKRNIPRSAKIFLNLVGLQCIILFSQDFLAFQLLLPITALIFIAASAMNPPMPSKRASANVWKQTKLTLHNNSRPRARQ